MTHRCTLEAVECSIRDICNMKCLVRGKIVIFGGDFRQVLPVVTKGNRADVVASSISRASFWCYCNIQHLKINMRLMHSNLSHEEHEWLRGFAKWTLNVGNNSVQGYSLLGVSEPDWIEIPDEFLINNDNNGLKNLIEFVYHNLVDRFKDDSYFRYRCILAPLNSDVDELNYRILEMLPGNSHTYLSNTDSVIDDINPL